MAFLATLEGLGVPTKKNSSIFGACLGACDAVGDVLSACLGESDDDAFAPTGLNRAAAMKSLKNSIDGNEWYINEDSSVFNNIIHGYNVPQPSFLKSKDGTITWSFAGKQLISWGINPETYKVKTWFYPVQSFLAIWENVYKNNPTLNAEERAAIAYYNWLGTYFEPRDAAEKNIYQYKLNTLKSFIAAAGFPSAIRKVEGEISRAGQAAQAAQQASAAAAAYKAAMERQEKEIAEAKAAQEKATKIIINETGKGDGNGEGNGTPAADSNLLPLLGLAAAAAVAFMG